MAFRKIQSPQTRQGGQGKSFTLPKPNSSPGSLQFWGGQRQRLENRHHHTGSV
jgi:hypothetical protein